MSTIRKFVLCRIGSKSVLIKICFIMLVEIQSIAKLRGTKIV